MINDFLKFCREKVYIWGIGITVILSYGLLIGTTTIGVDDEKIESYIEGGELVAQDRVGCYIAHKIFPSYVFLPWWVTGLGVLLFTLGVLFLLYVVDNKLHGIFPKGVVTIAGAIFISFPYIGKFAIFYGNMITMGYVICLTSVALYAAFCIWDNINIKQVIILSVCLLGVFLFEKAYIVLFCQGAAFYVLMKKYLDRDVKLLKIIKWVVFLCMAIAVTFVLSKLVIYLIQWYLGYPSVGYTSSYISYDFSNMKNFINSVKNFITAYIRLSLDMVHTLVGEKIYVAAIGCMLIFVIYWAAKKKDILIALIGMGNIILTACMYLVTGNIYLPCRTYCFNYAFFVCITVLLLGYIIVRKENWKSIIFYLVCFLIIGNQSKEMEQIYYQKYITFSKDKQLAEQIMEEVERECGRITSHNKPIIFMGFPDDYVIGWSEVEESSLFIYGRNGSTADEERADKIYNLYEKLGYSLKRAPSDVNYYDIRCNISDMSSFPEMGCVKETRDYIIVKLGDSFCEILNSNSQEWLSDENLNGHIEWCNYENRMLSMGGFLIKLGSPSFNNNISLILSNGENQYRMRIDEFDFRNITDSISDGINYDYCGFNTNILLSSYVADGEYEIYLELLDSEDKKYLYDIGQTIVVN